MRISATTLESYRLWRDPEQEWMPEEELIATIKGEFRPNHKINLGSAFGKVLEDPDRYMVPGGFRVKVWGEVFEFGMDVMEEPLALVDRRGVFEAKALASYGDCDVVSKADHLLGSVLSEFKTTLSSFDVSKYLDSCQWRFMADAFKPTQITYRVFCLDEAVNGVISLRSIENVNLFPYAELHADCAALVREFKGYCVARGLDGILRQRQVEAA
jgi:hypothetical protein